MKAGDKADEKKDHFYHQEVVARLILTESGANKTKINQRTIKRTIFKLCTQGAAGF